MAQNDTYIEAFATPIFTRQFDDKDDLNMRLGDAVREMAKSGKSNDQYRSHQGGFYTPGSLFNQPPPDAADTINEIQQVFRAGIREYINRVAETGRGRIRPIPDDWILLQGWAALTKAGDYQPPHVHGGSNMSCIYYVEVPEKPDPQGTIDLMNPLPIQEMTFIPGGQTTHARVPPRAGMLLIFPAYISHTVHPFEGDGERICVVANAVIRPIKE